MKAWNLKKGDMFRLHPARKAHRVDSIQHLCRGGEGEGAARPLRVELATVVEGSSQRVFRALDADQEIFPVVCTSDDPTNHQGDWCPVHEA